MSRTLPFIPGEAENPPTGNLERFTEPETGLLPDVPEHVYHAGRETLSSTGAKTLLHSPRKFWWQQNYGQERSDALEFGSLVHALILQQPHNYALAQEPIEVACPSCNAAPGAPCEGVKTFHRPRKPETTGTPVSKSDWDKAHHMAEAVAHHPIASDLFTNGKAEVSAYGIEPDSGVRMRGRFDWLRDDGWLIDLKTTTDASPDGFAKSIANYRYHLQAAWYMCLAEQNGIEVQGFRFVAVEKTAPHVIGIYELDHDAIERGWALAQKACDLYRQCQAFNIWPSWPHQDEITTLRLPGWADRDQDLSEYSEAA